MSNNRLTVKDMQVRDVVIDFAKILNVDYEEDNNEICIDVPEGLGTGFMRAVTFDFGLGVLEVDCQLKEGIELRLDNGLVQPLKIMFNREANFKHLFEDTKDVHTIGTLESTILSCNRKQGHVFHMPGNQPICVLSLEINRKLFEKKIETFVEEMDDKLEKLFRDLNGVNLFYYKGFYSLEIAKFLEEFTDCELEGFMRSVYLEGKAYEILTHQLKQYLDDLNGPDHRKILRQSTVNRVKEAADIIRKELEDLPNVLTLAHRVGLNQNTLQNGFQTLFKASVNQYIKDLRLDKATELLETTDMNITEITYQIGINSRSYFSKLFKERYGVGPKEYAEKVRSKAAAK